MCSHFTLKEDKGMLVYASQAGNLFIRLLLLLVLGTLAACGTGGSDDDKLTGPGIVSTTPTGKDVGSDSGVSISFTEPVYVDSFVLTSSHGATVTGTVQGNGTSKLTFVPNTHLNLNTTYTATVTNIRDGEGNGIGNYSWSFSSTAAVLNYHVTPDSHFFDVGTFNSSALSPVDGRTYVTYFNKTTKSLYILATTDGTDFDGPYLVDNSVTSQNVGEYSSLAIDGAGILHVAYYHQNVGLKYATAVQMAGPWTKTTVDSGSVGQYASLAVFQDGSIHISYYDQGNTSLKYARRLGGSWTKETIDTGLSGDNPGMYTSIKVDPDGFVHISYYDFHLSTSTSYGNLKYVKGKAGSWNTPLTLDSTGNVGEFSSLGLLNGSVFIVYNHVFPDGHRTVRIITNASGDWKHFDIVTVSLSAFDNSITTNPLAIDPTGTMHISYYIGGTIYYASGILYNAPTNNWDWATAAIVDDSQIGHGIYSSIVVDAGGQVSISYYDLTDGDLKYAQ